MAKDNKATPDENNDALADQNASPDALADQNAGPDALAELQAKHDALADEVLTLQELVELLKQENQALKGEIAALRETTNQVATSVSIAPPAPAAPVRPVVEIEGQKYQFKMGSFRIGRSEVFATDVAADETILNEIFSKYPGLFKKL